MRARLSRLAAAWLRFVARTWVRWIVVLLIFGLGAFPANSTWQALLSMAGSIGVGILAAEWIDRPLAIKRARRQTARAVNAVWLAQLKELPKLVGERLNAELNTKPVGESGPEHVVMTHDGTVIRIAGQEDDGDAG